MQHDESLEMLFVTPVAFHCSLPHMDTDDEMCSCPADMPDTDAKDDDDPLHRDGRREADLPLMI